MTRRKSSLKSNGDIDIHDMMLENMNKPVVRANSITRKRANEVKQANMDTQEAKEGTNFSYAFRDYMTRKKQKERSRIGRNPSPNKTRRRSRSRSRSRRERSRFNPYDDYSELNQLIKSNASQPVVRNKMGPTSVKQSKYDTEGTFNHPFG